MAEEEIRKEGTQEIQTTGEGTSTGAEHSKTVTMTPEEIARLVQTEVDRALAKEKEKGTFSGEEAQLEDMTEAIERISRAVEKSSRSNKVAAVGSILLLAVFGVAFALITPGMFTLLGNLNSTVSGLETTVNEVNNVVASANDTAQKLNGIVGDVGVQIGESFDQVNDVIGNVNDQVSGVGEAIDGLNSAVTDIDDVVKQNTDSIHEIVEALSELDYDGINTSIANIKKSTDGLQDVVDNVNDSVLEINKATKDADVAINQINDLDFEELNKTVAKLSEAAGQMNTVAGQLNTTAATLHKTVSKTSGEVDDTMEALGNIDFEGFNRSIKSLSQAAEDLQETASGIKKVTSTFIGGKSTGKTEKKSSK